jgi:hypothetical protein
VQETRSLFSTPFVHLDILLICNTSKTFLHGKFSSISMERSKIYNEHQVSRKYDFNFENQSEVQHSYNLSPAN